MSMFFVHADELRVEGSDDYETAMQPPSRSSEIHTKAIRLAVIGQGDVGLRLALRAVEAGYEVVGFDTDKHTISSLAAGRSPLSAIPESSIARALSSGRYSPTESTYDISGFDVALIVEPAALGDETPSAFLEQTAEAIGRFIRPASLVILDVAGHIGSTQDLLGPLLESESGLQPGTDFHFGCSTEVNVADQSLNPYRARTRLVSGVTGASDAAITSFCTALLDETILVGTPREIEFTKLASEAFRYVNIALGNELAMEAHEAGIDFGEVVQRTGQVPFGFMPTSPNLHPPSPMRLLALAKEVYQDFPSYIARRLQLLLSGKSKLVNGSRILLLGLGQIPNTQAERHAPAEALIDELLDLGAEVHVYDPFVAAQTWTELAPLIDLTVNEISSADAVVLLTDHDAISYHSVLDHGKLIFDITGRLHSPAVEHL